MPRRKRSRIDWTWPCVLLINGLLWFLIIAGALQTWHWIKDAMQ